MKNADRNEAGDSDAIGPGKYYAGLCLVALVVMVWGLNEIGLGTSDTLTLLPFILGVIALFFRFPSGAVMVLGTLSVLIAVQAGRGSVLVMPARTPSPAALFIQRMVMDVAALLFVIAYCRNLSLESGIFPPDRRKAPPAKAGGRPVTSPVLRRSAGLVRTGELAALAFLIPVFCSLSYVLWEWSNRFTPRVRLGDGRIAEWRLLTLCLVLGVVGWSGAVAIAYLDRARATPSENCLFLQDQLWHETRQEQGRVNRLLVRTRFRAQQREEKK
jgi:hypothetical protein